MTRTHPSGYTVGDRVYFGRGRGEKTLGEVVKTHGGKTGTGKPLSKLKVKTLEARGANRTRDAGVVWGVPPSLMSRATDGPAPTPTPAPYAVGERVVVAGYRGEVEVTVTKVGDGNRCEVYEPNGWFPRTAEVIRKATKRGPSAVRDDMARVRDTLDSPEVLWADGERSRSEVKRLVAALNRATRALGTELAR